MKIFEKEIILQNLWKHLKCNSQTFKRLNGNIMPTNILINKDGKILWRHYGYLPGDEIDMEKEIRSALKIDS